MDEISMILGKMAERNLIVDPTIRGLEKDIFEPQLLLMIGRATLDIKKKYYNWDPSNDNRDIRAEYFGDFPITERLIQSCIYDLLVSTSVFFSHDLKGKIQIDESIVNMAIHTIQQFIKEYGFANLFRCYAIVVGFENYQALAYYNGIQEKEFIEGSKHRPHISNGLDEELLIGMIMGYYKIEIIDNKRYVKLTEKGFERLNQIKNLLEESGYLSKRMQSMHVFQFDLLENWEALAEIMWPDIHANRKALLDFIGIQPGIKVLELGCGSGALTFEDGLAKRVGETGWIAATDPSAGMIHRAKQKAQSLYYKNVNFELCAAENLPFEDQEFDLVLGFGFFHFTEHDKALREMIRVCKKGGQIALTEPLATDMNKPFFMEWFSEFFELAKKRGAVAPPNYLLAEGQLEELFAKHGLVNIESQKFYSPWVYDDPEAVVKTVIQGVGFFQQEMIYIPWAARQELTKHLIYKGYEIRQKYTLEERTIQLPGIHVKGTVV